MTSAWVRALALRLAGTTRLENFSSRLAPRRIGCDGGGGGAVLDTELGVDLLEVLVDGPWAQAQDLGDVAVGLAFRKPGQHFALTRRQPELAGKLGRQIGAGVLGQ